ncbi:MAG: hypothetical protein H0X46_06695 [Bacteroidetes bacterium]|nr:hypothetical protein [Bacteroidota bacterium]
MIKNKIHKEGKVAKAIEKVTAKLPSDLFLWTSFVAMGAALTFKLTGRDHWGLFIGQWAAPILIMGLYNKLVKVEGHDKQSK